MDENDDARGRLSRLWDAEIARFLEGDTSVSPELLPWFESYSGRGDGTVDTKAFPEPFLGPLMGRPKAAFLALNPGQVYERFQYPGGVFVKELEQTTYTEWAARWRYLDSDHEVVGGLRFHGIRLRFLRGFLDDASLGPEDMLAFELYPWHSKKVTAAMAPDPQTIERFILEPIAESGAGFIFGFGSPWFRILEELGCEEICRLGEGGDAYATSVKSRIVRVFEGTGGAKVVIEKHMGGAGPPSVSETELLRSEFLRRGLL